MSTKMMRVLVALLLLVTFTAEAATAAPRSLSEEPASMAALWQWITAWFQSSTLGEGGGGENPDEGSHMDPDGLKVGIEGGDPNS